MSIEANSNDVEYEGYSNSSKIMLVTAVLGEQRFGIPVEDVQDVLIDVAIAPIPRSDDDVAGSINLRGRIVTVIDLWARLGKPTEHCPMRTVLIVVKHEQESYSLLVDAVGEVTEFPQSQITAPPPNLSEQWSEVASGVCQLENELMIVVDINNLLTFRPC